MDKCQDHMELINYIWHEALAQERNPVVQLGMRLKKTLSSQGAPCAVCGSTIDVQMHHTNPVKNIKDKDMLRRHIKAMNIPQIPLCRVHHLEAHRGN